jgi:hypothetical protein
VARALVPWHSCLQRRDPSRRFFPECDNPSTVARRIVVTPWGGKLHWQVPKASTRVSTRQTRVVSARQRAGIRMKTGAVAPDHSLTFVARNRAATVKGAFSRHARRVFKGVRATEPRVHQAHPKQVIASALDGNSRPHRGLTKRGGCPAPGCHSEAAQGLPIGGATIGTFLKSSQKETGMAFI